MLQVALPAIFGNKEEAKNFQLMDVYSTSVGAQVFPTKDVSTDENDDRKWFDAKSFFHLGMIGESFLDVEPDVLGRDLGTELRSLIDFGNDWAQEVPFPSSNQVSGLGIQKAKPFGKIRLNSLELKKVNLWQSFPEQRMDQNLGRRSFRTLIFSNARRNNRREGRGIEAWSLLYPSSSIPMDLFFSKQEIQGFFVPVEFMRLCFWGRQLGPFQLSSKQVDLEFAIDLAVANMIEDWSLLLKSTWWRPEFSNFLLEIPDLSSKLDWSTLLQAPKISFLDIMNKLSGLLMAFPMQSHTLTLWDRPVEVLIKDGHAAAIFHESKWGKNIVFTEVGN